MKQLVSLTSMELTILMRNEIVGREGRGEVGSSD